MAAEPTRMSVVVDTAMPYQQEHGASSRVSTTRGASPERVSLTRLSPRSVCEEIGNRQQKSWRVRERSRKARSESGDTVLVDALSGRARRATCEPVAPRRYVVTVTVVFLHALPFGAAMWHPLVGSRADVVCPNLYDFGDSIGAWADAILDLVPGGALTLVGNSVGGSCAIEIAVRAPERVARLVLVGTKAGHRPEPEFRDEAVRLLLEEGLAAAWAKYWRPLFAPATAPEIVDSARRMALEEDVDAVVRGVRAFHSRPDRATWITQFDRPVAVINGEHDRPSRGRALAGSVPCGTFHLIPAVGHYVPLEAPALLSQIIGWPEPWEILVV